ncbi:MAG: hypothetical protein IJL02_11650, partial [Methanobrevibacter sp.]|uniref:hypothetical protein n=1 Tax=Methanobrevibacter sp. TaxID=66852 RepID=UPI0025EA9FCB
CGFAVLDPDLPAHCVDDKRATALPIISGLLRCYQFLQTNLRIILDTTLDTTHNLCYFSFQSHHLPK